MRWAYNRELAELVLMLKPPGPLADRARAIIFRDRTKQEVDDGRVVRLAGI
jgi:hypothetical protein